MVGALLALHERTTTSIPRDCSMKIVANQARRLRRAGFTLLELIVVIGILVILAGLVVGKLDLLQVRANKGVAASNMSGVGRLIRLYRVSHQGFPDNWDSLITTNGATRGTALWKATTTDRHPARSRHSP